MLYLRLVAANSGGYEWLYVSQIYKTTSKELCYTSICATFS